MGGRPERYAANPESVIFVDWQFVCAYVQPKQDFQSVDFSALNPSAWMIFW